MKIKTLAIAAATLAVGAISSQAQAPVYSQNVVGYVNVICPASKYVFIENPMDTGNNVITNVIKGAPGASQLLYWNGSGFSTFTFSLGHWKSGAVNVDNTNLPPGMGFFMLASANFTNTFVGNFLSASSYTNALSTVLTPVGSILPYSDVVTNKSTINLGVPGATQLQQWNTTAQAFTTFTYNGISKVWKIGALSTNPVVNVGDAYFILSASATNWVQTSP